MCDVNVVIFNEKILHWVVVGYVLINDSCMILLYNSTNIGLTYKKILSGES